jgi:hypothetical protein
VVGRRHGVGGTSVRSGRQGRSAAPRPSADAPDAVSRRPTLVGWPQPARRPALWCRGNRQRHSCSAGGRQARAVSHSDHHNPRHGRGLAEPPDLVAEGALGAVGVALDSALVSGRAAAWPVRRHPPPLPGPAARAALFARAGLLPPEVAELVEASPSALSLQGELEVTVLFSDMWLPAHPALPPPGTRPFPDGRRHTIQVQLLSCCLADRRTSESEGTRIEVGGWRWGVAEG